MNDLIPTPIVDKNGKKTTVHKSPTKAASGNTRATKVNPVPAVEDEMSPELKKFITQTKNAQYRRMRDGAVISFESIESTGFTDIDGRELVTLTLKKWGSHEVEEHSTVLPEIGTYGEIPGYDKLITDVYVKYTEHFQADRFNDYHIGHLFDGRNVSELAELNPAYNGNTADLDKHNYLILTAIGESPNLNTGRSDIYFRFQSVDGSKVYGIRVPRDKANMLADIEMRPSRHSWEKYAPSTIADR